MKKTDELVSFSNVVFGRMERGLGLKLRNCFKASGKVHFLAIKVVH